MSEHLFWRSCFDTVCRALSDRALCLPVRCNAYLCCPCTLGISLFLYRNQASNLFLIVVRIHFSYFTVLKCIQALEAEEGVAKVIGFINEDLQSHSCPVSFELRRQRCNTRLYVRVLNATIGSVT